MPEENAKFDREVNDLIYKLIGDHLPEEDIVAEEYSNETYQLPVKHTREGSLIDDDNKPWVVGTFLPGQFINDTHPQGHEGVDLKGPRGTPIYPIASGVVKLVGVNPKGGNFVTVLHEDKHVSSYYAHLDSINVTKGQEVTQSTILGSMGDSGNAKGRGAHLHYEVKVDGKKIDPLDVVGKRVGSLSKIAETIIETIELLNKFAEGKDEDQMLIKTIMSKYD